MRLLSAEFKKLFTKKIFVSCLILFFIANAVILCYEQSSDFTTLTVHNNRQAYEKLVNDCSGLNLEQVQQYLDSQDTVMSIASNIRKLSETDEPERISALQNSLDNFKKENPNEYEQASKLNMTKEELGDYYIMVYDLKSQCSKLETFKIAIEEMEQRAQQQSFFAIFSQEGTFSESNTTKTLEDFQCMKNRDVRICNSLAVSNATQFGITDYLVFALVFIMCILLFTVERDKNLYGLIRSTQKGRLPLITSKLAALAILTVIFSVIYYSSNIAVCGIYSGFGDWSNTVQSVPIFSNCNLTLTIGQYLLCWTAVKTFAMCGIAFLLALIFIAVKNTSTIFVISAAVFGTEFALFSTIDRNSWINQLKYINLVNFVNGNQILGDYLNINLFTFPVNLLTVYSVTIPTILAVTVTLCCVLFVVQTQTSKLAVWSILTDKLKAKFAGIRGSVNILAAESFKHYKGSLAALAIILLALLAYSSLNADLTFNYTDASDLVYSSYLAELEGELTPEKEAYIAKEQQTIADAYAKIAEIQSDPALSEEEKSQSAGSILLSIENKEKGLNKVTAQYEYIKATGSERGLTPFFVDEIIYKRLLQNPTKEWQYFALLMLVVIFCASNIFAYEYTKGMVNLIRCTKKGKLQLVLSKLFIVLITTTISYILIYLPYMINFAKTFGSTSLNAPLIFLPDFCAVDSNITIIQSICVISAVHIITALAAAIFVSMLSLILKNNITVMIVGGVIILVPCIVFYNNEKVRLFSTFISGTQLVTCIVVTALAVVIAAVSFMMIVKIFFPLRRSKNA